MTEPADAKPDEQRQLPETEADPESSELSPPPSTSELQRQADEFRKPDEAPKPLQTPRPAMKSAPPPPRRRPAPGMKAPSKKPREQPKPGRNQKPAKIDLKDPPNTPRTPRRKRKADDEPPVEIALRPKRTPRKSPATLAKEAEEAEVAKQRQADLAKAATMERGQRREFDGFIHLYEPTRHVSPPWDDIFFSVGWSNIWPRKTEAATDGTVPLEQMHMGDLECDDIDDFLRDEAKDVAAREEKDETDEEDRMWD